jgi:hypothetical protein
VRNVHNGCLHVDTQNDTLIMPTIQSRVPKSVVREMIFMRLVWGRTSSFVPCVAWVPGPHFEREKSVERQICISGAKCAYRFK